MTTPTCVDCGEPITGKPAVIRVAQDTGPAHEIGPLCLKDFDRRWFTADATETRGSD